MSFIKEKLQKHMLARKDSVPTKTKMKNAYIVGMTSLKHTVALE